MNETIPSLRSHLMHRLLTALYVLWLISTIVGYFATLNYANKPYDQVLLHRAGAVAEELELGTGHERLDKHIQLPDGTDPGMPDKVVYTVSDSAGHKLAGTASLARPLSYRRNKEGPLFSNSERDGQKTRMVSLVYHSPANGQIFQLHVSETTRQRQELTRGILANIVIPQLLLILIAVGAVWYGLQQGFAPLERLRREVSMRRKDDLSHLDGNKAPSEVRPLIDAVNDLLDRLKQAMTAQKRFVADAAHQLRTPLAGLKTQVELALREQDQERQRHILQHVLTSTRHASHLANQLLMLARNEPGGQGTQVFAPVDINQLARDRTTNCVQQALGKNIDIGFEGGTQAMVHGDADSLGEMLCNLIDNAIRYTQEGGHITVRVSCEGPAVTLQVQDNGPGIEPQYRSRVFERFYRILGNSQSGSGLGLAIVAEVAKRHGAEISLNEGSGGTGTLVSIRFPRHPT